MDSTRMPVNKNGGHRFIKRRKVAGFTLLLHNHENNPKTRPHPVLAAGGFMALCQCGSAPGADFCRRPTIHAKGGRWRSFNPILSLSAAVWPAWRSEERRVGKARRYRRTRKQKNDKEERAQ